MVANTKLCLYKVLKYLKAFRLWKGMVIKRAIENVKKYMKQFGIEDRIM